jgi:hypothetical protein
MKVGCDSCYETGETEAGWAMTARGVEFRKASRCRVCKGTGYVSGRTFARRKATEDAWLADRA